MSSRFLPVLLVVAALGASLPALAAEPPVTVKAIAKKEVTAYDAKGNALPAPIPASAFKLPVTTADFGPGGGSIGLPYQGKTVYVRKVDLITVTPSKCAEMTETETRSAGALKAGERLGSGDSANCMVSP